jgi:arylsulfatase A
MIRALSVVLLLFVTVLRAADRPSNIVMILADDMGWADLGADGSKIDTPHLDRMAKDGVKLTRFYASAPMCSPTRAALLTGRYPHSVGMPELASKTARGNVPILSLAHEAITIPEALKPGRYRSIAVGKWHLGFEPKDFPQHHGFDEFWGSLLGTPNFWQPKETYHNAQPMQIGAGVHFTDAITDKAVEQVRAQRGREQPLFLYLAYNAPHYPLEAPPDLVSKYRRRFPERGLFAIYAAMVEQLDAGIGRVLAALQEANLADNTLVVFSSDNGPSAELTSYGPEGAEFSNGPLREYKFSVHEGGLRVPFIARWPGKIPPGTVHSQPAVTMDLLPTFLEAAAIKPASTHEIHGTSLVSLLTRGQLERKGAVHWETQNNAAVLMGEWKLVHQYWRAPSLYRIAEDPSETNDLAAANPEKVTELMALHERWKARYYPNPVARQKNRSTYAFPAPPWPQPGR